MRRRLLGIVGVEGGISRLEMGTTCRALSVDILSAICRSQVYRITIANPAIQLYDVKRQVAALLESLRKDAMHEQYKT